MSTEDKVKFTSNSQISRREFLTLDWQAEPSSLVRLELDPAQCTGCGLCALDCATAALTVSADTDSDTFRLLFESAKCNGCGRCVTTCPEKCVRLEGVPEVGSGNATVLFEDRLVRCRECGSVVAPQSMLRGLQSRMAAAGQNLAAQIELCPDCRARAGSLGDGLGRSERMMA